MKTVIATTTKPALKLPRAIALAASVWILAIGATPGLAANDPITELFQKGLMEEETQRDLTAAIQTYEEVLKRIDNQRRVAATTVFRLGESYRKLQRTNEAVRLFTRLLREFPEETTLADLSRQNLLSLGSKAAPAGESTSSELDEEGKELLRLRTLATTSPDLLDAPNSQANGFTPLQLAALNGWTRVIDFLLKAGVGRDNFAGQELAPLHQAALMGHKTAVERLIEAGSSINLTNKHGMTPLHMAIGRERKQMAQWLLEKGADPNRTLSSRPTVVMSFVVEDGMTPLGIALINRWEQGVELLLAHKASVTLGGRTSTPLEIAARTLSPTAIEKLVAAGADPQASYSDSLYSLAVRLGGLNQPRLAETLQALHKVGVPLSPSLAAPLLRSSVDKGDAAAVQALLGLGASPNPPVNEEASPLLMVALDRFGGRGDSTEMRSSGARLQVLNQLLAAGANPNQSLPDGSSPLQVAVQKAEPILVAALLKAGANPNYTKGNRPFPLAEAIQTGTNIVSLLLNAGANPDGASGGVTPLLQSVFVVSYEPMKLLLDHGANPNLRPGVGRPTPLEQARISIQRTKDPSPNGWRASEKVIETLEKQVALLLQRGAKDEVPDFSLIQARRGTQLRTTVYTRPTTNDWNPFTLHDALANLFGIFESPRPASRFSASRPSTPPTILSPQAGIGRTTFTWPAVEDITLERFSEKGEKTVFLTGLTNQVLQWGDVIVIPEAPHPLDASWGGLTREQREAITTPLHGSIRFSVGGLTNELKYEGGHFPSWGLEDLLMGTKLLKSTSDLTRVKVIRPSGGGNEEKKVWTVNLREPGDWPDLWLRPGDSVVVDSLPSVPSR